MNAAISLGKYQILGELGKGGFATVYRARDSDLGREVALKVLDPLLTRDPVWVARFRREARAVASLDHPRVVTVHEIGQAEGSLYIAMKLMEEGSLAQRIAAQGPLPWDEVARLAGQIAEALDFAHSQGVLHRDLKPANVLLDARLGAVLSDFGFASLVADNSLSISMSGGVVGTPAYIAPEVWEGDDPTPQTDIYALGCIVYEMVSGQALFAGNSTPAVMRAHFQPRKLPETWPEGTPPGLTDVLLTALAQEPAGRYATAGDLSATLAVLQEDPLAEPYAGLQAAVEAGRWQEALALAGQVRAIDACYRDVVVVEAAALAGLEQDARVQQAVEWRTEAERALADGEFKDARQAGQKWQELTPDDPEIDGFGRRLADAQRVPVVPDQSADPPPSEVAELAEDRLAGGVMVAIDESTAETDVVAPAPDFNAQGFVEPRQPLAATRWRLMLSMGGVALALAVIILLARSLLAPNQPSPSMSAALSVDNTSYFTSNRSGKPEVYRILSDGQIEQVTHTPGQAGSWFPVLGSRGVLYYVSDRDGKREIYRLDQSGKAERVTNTPGSAESWSPAVGSDGALYFTSDRDGKREVYQLNSSGIALRVTSTSGARSSWSPATSPDGVLYWTSDRDGKPEIYRFDETGATVRVTRTPGSAGSWSPALGRGGTFFFTSDRDEKAEVYWFSADGAALRGTHTPGAAESWAPSVGRDGTLSFNSNRDGKTEVYRVDRSGHVVRATNTAGSGESWLNTENANP